MTAPALTQYVQGITPVTADGLNTFEQTCDTAADLQAFVGTQGMQVFLRGLSSINDGGQGAFYWNANGSANDGVNNIQPSGAATGTWTRITSATPSLIYCTASGTNAITLTPDTPVGEYENGQLFGFVAAQTSTGNITLGVGSLSALPVYLPTAAQASTGVFVSGTFYIVAYVPSYNGNAGGWAIVSALASVPPQVTVLTTSSVSPYTPPTGCIALAVRMAGGGGGGGGAGSGSGGGGTGGTTTFGSSLFQCTGGAGGSNAGGAAGGSGGGATGGTLNLNGANGSPGSSINDDNGGNGGSSPFGGAGPGAAGNGNPGVAAQANTGSGGGGASTSGSVSVPGGAAGGYLEGLISTPNIAASYQFTVGAGGTGGSAGSGQAGGAGGSGIIIVTALFG